MFNKNNIRPIVRSLYFERFITLIILLNSILVGVETSYQNDLISIIQISCLVIFVIEISLRFIARDSTKSFLKEGWNIFDLVIVLISLFPEDISGDSGLVSSFRVLRIFRVLRLLRASPEIRLIVSVLIKSIKSLWYNAMVYVIFCYLFTLIGVVLFKLPSNITEKQKNELTEVTSLGDNIDPFASVGEGFLTLFSITLGYEWWQTRNTLEKSSELQLIESSHSVISTYLFVWYGFAVFLLLNLVVGAVINNYQIIIEEIKDKDKNLNI
ncbi:MAG: transporter [Crocinitomicaceae bacterium]|nr:transporter [Crocinitomicaceae bacterium]|tara:strand:- start:1556 stop:2362 length:807 start_codon:yes stop_codon:yes gene_type:complete